MFFSVSIVPDMPVPRRKRRHGDMRCGTLRRHGSTRNAAVCLPERI